MKQQAPFLALTAPSSASQSSQSESRIFSESPQSLVAIFILEMKNSLAFFSVCVTVSRPRGKFLQDVGCFSGSRLGSERRPFGRPCNISQEESRCRRNLFQTDNLETTESSNKRNSIRKKNKLKILLIIDSIFGIFRLPSADLTINSLATFKF